MMNSTVPAGCWDLDLETGMLALCARSRTMFGLSPRSGDRLAEREWTRRFHPDDLEPVRQALTASVERGVPYAQRFRIVRPDGSLRLVVGIGHPLKSGRTFARFVGWNFDVVSSGQMAADWILTHPEALNSEPRVSVSPSKAPSKAALSNEPPSDTLLERAQSILRVRRARERMLGRAAISDPAFDLLLCLYVRSGQVETSLINLARSANTPYSSAMRWIRYLGDKGLVERMESGSDRRSTLVRLTPSGRAVLDELFALR